MTPEAPLPWVRPFLDALRRTGVVTRACEAVGIPTSSPYDLRKRDADFDQSWKDAMEDATDDLEQEARRRAMDGIHEPVVYQGQLTPLYETDANGQIIVETYDTGSTTKDGRPIMGSRNRQLVIDGHPQWLTLNKRSDALLMFLLKGLRKKYGTDTHEISGRDGAPLSTIDETTKAARIAALLALAKQRKTTSEVDDLL